MRLDPDLPGNYTATLVVSNGTTQGSVKVPFTVVPDAPYFRFPVFINVYSPTSPLAIHMQYAVRIDNVGSNYPWTAEVFFNDASQGFLSPQNYIAYGGNVHGRPPSYAYLLPISAYPGGSYTVKVVVRAGGQSTEFSEQLTFPPCETPGTTPSVRPCTAP
jgi:hypothetical protein